MSKFKFRGVVYCYTTMIPEELIEDFNKNSVDENSFTMYGDSIKSYKGKIYCQESEFEIWQTEVFKEV